MPIAKTCCTFSLLLYGRYTIEYSILWSEGIMPLQNVPPLSRMPIVQRIMPSVSKNQQILYAWKTPCKSCTVVFWALWLGSHPHAMLSNSIMHSLWGIPLYFRLNPNPLVHTWGFFCHWMVDEVVVCIMCTGNHVVRELLGSYHLLNGLSLV